jgi:CheY-like chemotaxis protein
MSAPARSLAAGCCGLGPADRTEGIDVTDVRTGDAAITAAIAFHPDVVIVDVVPADPAGFLIVRRLQALPDAPHVVLTSSSNRRRFGSQLDSHLFIPKADLCARVIGERADIAGDGPPWLPAG